MSNLPEDRGRKPIVSTGRGGAGNLIRSPSRGVDPEVVPGAERGREFTPKDVSGDHVTHSGRGGAGNIRSPSRDPKSQIQEEEESALQEKLVSEARGRQADAPFSTGRGGAGNIRDKSQSRSRSAVRGGGGGVKNGDGNGSPLPHHQHHGGGGGRGGWGNITHEDGKSIDQDTLAEQKKHDEAVIAQHHAEDAKKPHMVGKGGAGNYGQTFEPVDMSKLTLEEKEAHAKLHAKEGHRVYSGGRGGAGNIHPSPEDGERGRGDHKDKGGMLGSVLRSISRATGRDKSTDNRKD